MTALHIHANSPLRYNGGKSKRVVRLTKFADTYKTHYVEPFAGGLSFLFRARRDRLFKSYAASDIDPRNVNFWLILRDQPEALCKRLWRTYQTYGANDEGVFRDYQCRLDDDHDPVGRAAAYYWVSKCALRVHEERGMLKSPRFRKGVTPGMLDRLPVYSELLQGVTISHADYRTVDLGPTVFAYLDAPYEIGAEAFYRYGVDLEELRGWIDSARGSWLLTMNDSAATRRLFAEYDILLEPVRYPSLINPRFVGGFSRHKDATELVVMNYRRATRNAFVRRFGSSVAENTVSVTRA